MSTIGRRLAELELEGIVAPGAVSDLRQAGGSPQAGIQVKPSQNYAIPAVVDLLKALHDYKNYGAIPEELAPLSNPRTAAPEALLLEAQA